MQPGWVEINADRTPDERAELVFTNTADRPIQVGSHIHLGDVNAGLSFDRDAAFGHRLDIAAGTSVRFEPGASRSVAVVTFRGHRSVPGLQVANALSPTKVAVPRVIPAAADGPGSEKS